MQLTQTLSNVPPRNPKTPLPAAWPGAVTPCARVRRPGALGAPELSLRLKRRLQRVAEPLLKDSYAPAKEAP